MIIRYELTLCIILIIAGGGFSKLCNAPVMKLNNINEAVSARRNGNIPSRLESLMKFIMTRTVKIRYTTATIL